MEVKISKNGGEPGRGLGGGGGRPTCEFEAIPPNMWQLRKIGIGIIFRPFCFDIPKYNALKPFSVGWRDDLVVKRICSCR